MRWAGTPGPGRCLLTEPENRRVRVRFNPINLGFPRREMWDDPAYYTRFGGPRMDRVAPRFVPNPADPNPVHVQRAWHEICAERDLGKLRFTHLYEKTWRMARRKFLWRHKRWKAPVEDFGLELAQKETRNRVAWESFKDQQAAGAPLEEFGAFMKRIKANEIPLTTNPLEMQLEIKDRLDFGGVEFGRQVT